jgi:LEA14-like dessication related protein
MRSKIVDIIKAMSNLKLYLGTFLGMVLTGFCLSCAAEAVVVPRSVMPVPHIPPQKSPVATVSFDRIEAADINHVDLFFLLEAQNPRSSAARLEIQDWNAVINGSLPGEGAVLSMDGDVPLLDAGASLQIPLRLSLDLRDLPPVQEDFDEYRTDLDFNLGFVFDNQDTAEILVASQAVFPRIREPDFSITAIAIMKAELINTRFRVKLQVDNPNVFPVELSSFSYALYGADRFWADGKKTEVLRVPARGSAETEIFLVMNFIDMRRELLDQIVAMRQVNYRFSGEAVINTEVEYLPSFLAAFDRSGNSMVID